MNARPLPRALVSEHHALLDRIAAEVGSAYVYDLDAMRRHAADLRVRFAPARIYYAIKANPLQEVVHALEGVLDGVEIASEGELAYVRDLGIGPERILFGGPAKRPAAVAEAIRSGVRAIHLDSLDELQYARAARRASQSTRLAIRVNTRTGVDAPFDNMVGGASRFGVDEELLDVLATSGELAGVDGIHVYSGSQIRDWNALAKQFRHTVGVKHDLHRSLGTLRYVNFGGGFGVPHSTNDIELDVGRLAVRLKDAIRDLALPTDGEAAIELGRYLTAPFGVLVTTVRAGKTSRGRRYALLDCGYNGFIRPMLTGENHQIHPLGSDAAADTVTVVGGPLCTPTDTFGELPGWLPEQGQAVAVEQAGAYGWSMSPHFFLGHPTAAEVVLENGTYRVVRERLDPIEYMSLGRRHLTDHHQRWQ
jgi:diaminopimelate decarboxylase